MVNKGRFHMIGRTAVTIVLIIEKVERSEWCQFLRATIATYNEKNNREDLYKTMMQWYVFHRNRLLLFQLGTAPKSARKNGGEAHQVSPACFRSAVFFLLRPTLMSRIEHKCCLISTLYLTGLFEIFILLHVWLSCVCLVAFLAMRTLCDAYHKEFESH